MFDKLFRRNRKSGDSKDRAEKDSQRREAEKARHRAEAEMAKQRGWIESQGSSSSGGFYP